MGHSTASIRNICIAGHAGSGKTTLVEALLYDAGVINTRGSVETQDSVSDFDDDERRLGHSLSPSICSFDHNGLHLNLIDTPGYPDFIGRALSVLRAVETVAVVVDATVGVEMVTEQIMAAAKSNHLCRMIIVNGIDAAGADPARVLESLRDTFGPECLPLNLPVDRGASVKDCFFEPWSGDSDIGSFAEAHDRIVDQVVELDETLMELYLEQGEIVDAEQLHGPFERALREGHLVPVCFTSARENRGIDELLEVFERLMPNPDEGNPPEYLKGEGVDAAPVTVSTDTGAHTLAHVFKMTIDPFRGRLGFVRIHQGSIRRGAQMYIGDGRKPFKVGHLLKICGSQQQEVDEVVPGDICAIPRAEGFFFDAVLHDSHEEDHYHLRAIQLPEPIYGLAITPVNDQESQKVSDALHTLTDEDPSVRVEHSASLNETVIRGLGELHLQAVLDRSKNLYHVDVTTAPPGIEYRETITSSAEGHHRHKKQTGGAGQFGEVFLHIEPLSRDEGFEFVDKVVGGVIPHQFIPAIEKGVRQTMAAGAIAGFPMQDIRVTVYDGKHHAVDSKEIAFVMAGKKAFLNAVGKAGPIVLEPIVNVTVTAPADCMGAITGDISGMRGMISGSQAAPGNTVRIASQAPLAEIQTYHSRLKSISGGAGSFTMHFDHYAPVPDSVRNELENGFVGESSD
ncbi:MAG: elongation factor G [Chloroflexi bacterium]|nr:MAG: elongation factor G [Chloroflexota bacterium]